MIVSKCEHILASVSPRAGGASHGRTKFSGLLRRAACSQVALVDVQGNATHAAINCIVPSAIGPCALATKAANPLTWVDPRRAFRMYHKDSPPWVGCKTTVGVRSMRREGVMFVGVPDGVDKEELERSVGRAVKAQQMPSFSRYVKSTGKRRADAEIDWDNARCIAPRNKRARLQQSNCVCVRCVSERKEMDCRTKTAKHLIKDAVRCSTWRKVQFYAYNHGHKQTYVTRGNRGLQSRQNMFVPMFPVSANAFQLQRQHCVRAETGSNQSEWVMPEFWSTDAGTVLNASIDAAPDETTGLESAVILPVTTTRESRVWHGEFSLKRRSYTHRRK